MPNPKNEPNISIAIDCAERARLMPQKWQPNPKRILGHRWKLVCDLENDAATLFVDIGQWWPAKRAFYPKPDCRYSYPVKFSSNKNGVTYKLEIKDQILESYGKANEKPRVSSVEFYDDIIVEAHLTQSSAVDHKQVVADHPSLQFGTLLNGTDFQFMADWDSPSFRQEWSAPFRLRNQVTLRNTAIYLFEDNPERSYSIFEVDGGNNRPNPLSNVGLAHNESERIRFDLTAPTLTLTPPTGLQLQKFIIDPKFGSGDG